VSWIVPALWLFSLLSGLTAVICSCNQQITISKRLLCTELFKWMKEENEDRPSTGFAVPDFSTILTLSLPRKFLHYSLKAYMLGLAIYLAYLWRDSVGDEAPGDDRKIFITTIVSLVLCWAIVSSSDIPNRCRGSVWEDDWKSMSNC
jgi:hypothetical protein